MGVLSAQAWDIGFATDNDFFEAIGYLSKSYKITHIDAEVPDDYRQVDFRNCFPGQPYMPITKGYTRSGNPIKYSYQFRIYLSNIDNCPVTLSANINYRDGMGYSIDRGLFVEKLVEHFGFNFGDNPQNYTIIRGIVVAQYPRYVLDFDRGYAL